MPFKIYKISSWVVALCAIFLSVQAQEKSKFYDVNDTDTLEFDILQRPTPIVIETQKGKSIYHYFTYTVANKQGRITTPENLEVGDVLAEDIFTVIGILRDNEYVETVDGEVKVEEKDASDNIIQQRKNLKEPKQLPLPIAGIRKTVRLFVKGHVLNEKDIRILRRVPFNPLIKGNQRYNILNLKLNTTVPMDVIDFNGNTVLKEGDLLDARNLAILRQLPIAPIYLEKPTVVNLDIKVNYGSSKTMTCVPGCDEVYDVQGAFSGIHFHCGDNVESLTKLGIKRITKNSYYDGNDGITGCGALLTTPKEEYIPIYDQTVIDKIWDSEPKICQFCKTEFKVSDIRHFHKARLKHPTTGQFFEERISRFEPDAKIALGNDTFTIKDIKEYSPEEIMCPACGKWLRQDLTFLDLNNHPLKDIDEKDFYANIQKIPYGHIRRGISVFDAISDQMDFFDVVIAGLDERLYELKENGEYVPISKKKVRKVFDDLRYNRKLVIKYKRLGDEFDNTKDPFVEISRSWQFFKQETLFFRANDPTLKAVIKNRD